MRGLASTTLIVLVVAVVAVAGLVVVYQAGGGGISGRLLEPPTVTTSILDKFNNPAPNVILPGPLNLVHDKATVAGSGPLTPTGTVTFIYFPDTVDCTGISNSQNVALDISGSASSSQMIPGDGGLSYKVRYNGDPNYPAATSVCEFVRVEQTDAQGCTPGFWKNNLDKKSAKAWTGTGYIGSTTLGSAFTIPAALAVLSPKTFSNALDFGGGNDLNGAAQILLRSAVAALLNAANPNVGYPYTTQQIKDGVKNVLASGDRDAILSYYKLLDDANNLDQTSLCK